jgi:hypothetical protein
MLIRSPVRTYILESRILVIGRDGESRWMIFGKIEGAGARPNW